MFVLGVRGVWCAVCVVLSASFVSYVCSQGERPGGAKEDPRVGAVGTDGSRARAITSDSRQRCGCRRRCCGARWLRGSRYGRRCGSVGWDSIDACATRSVGPGRGCGCANARLRGRTEYARAVARTSTKRARSFLMRR